MEPSPVIETAQAGTAAARILCAVKENRIELIGVMILVILTVKNRPRNLLLSTRKRRTHAVRSDFFVSKV